MARRGSSSNGGGCLSVIVAIVVIGLAIQILPYALIIGACGFGIWLLVKLFQKINEGTNGQTVRSSNTQQSSIVYPAYPHENYIEYEVDRQIKDMLAGRLKFGRRALWLKFKLIHYKLPWNKSEEQKKRRKALEDEISVTEGRYYASTYRFAAPATNEFAILKNVLRELSQAEATVYDNSPALRSIFIPFKAIGDMKYLSFSEEPICVKIRNDIFCIAPCYIVRFKSSGAYVTTYNCEALKGGLENGGYNERIRHVTYLHTKMDGTPDRRYKHNPQQVYYTSLPRTVYDMLHFEIAEYHMKYSINGALRDRVNSAIRAYSEILPTKSFDPVYHLVRLMNICDDSSKTKNLASMLGGNFGFATQGDTSSSSDIQNYQDNKKNNITRWWVFLLKLIFGVACFVIAAFFVMGLLVSLSSNEWNVLPWALSIAGLFGVPGYGLVRNAIRDYKKMHNTLGVNALPETDEKKLNRTLAIITAILLILSVIFIHVYGKSPSENKQGNADSRATEQEEEQIVEQKTQDENEESSGLAMNKENEKAEDDTAENETDMGDVTDVAESDSEVIDEALQERLISKGNSDAPIHLGMIRTEVFEVLNEKLGNSGYTKDGELVVSMSNKEASELFGFSAIKKLPEIDEVKLEFDSSLLNKISLKTKWPDYVNISSKKESEETLKTLAKEMGASGDVECEFNSFKANNSDDYNIAIGKFEVSGVGIWAYIASTDYMTVNIYW